MRMKRRVNHHVHLVLAALAHSSEACSSYTSCSDCIFGGNCAWAPASMTCKPQVAGTNAPSAGLFISAVTECTCAGRSTCDSCHGSIHCGWCPSMFGGTCAGGGASGSINQQRCSSGWTTSECTTGSSSSDLSYDDGGPSTSSPSAGGGTGSTGSTGSLSGGFSWGTGSASGGFDASFNDAQATATSATVGGGIMVLIIVCGVCVAPFALFLLALVVHQRRKNEALLRSQDVTPNGNNMSANIIPTAIPTARPTAGAVEMSSCSTIPTAVPVEKKSASETNVNV